jgi:predicted transcriptional regulator
MQSSIIALLREEMSVSAIARELDVSRSSLKDYIESREIRKFIDKSWIEVSPADSEVSEYINSTLLICPFDKTDKKED